MLFLQRILPPNIRMTPNQVRKTGISLLVLVVLIVCLKIPVLRLSREHLSRSVSAEVDAAQKEPAKPCLVAEGAFFKLKGRETRILSGAIHYFRVPAAYWEDRMKKLQSMGLTTLET